MKTNFSIIIMCALCALTSCNKNVLDDSAGGDFNQTPKQVAVSFDLTDGIFSTKGTVDKPDAVKNVQIFAFNSNGQIDGYLYAKDTSKMKMTCVEGTHQIYAVVNGKNLSGIVTNVTEFLNVAVNLEENSRDSLIMLGSVLNKNLTVGMAPITIQVSRMVCRVGIGKLTVNMDVPAYKNKTIKLLSYALINVPGDANLGQTKTSTVIYSKDAVNVDLNEKILNLIYAPVNATVANGSSKEDTYYFYSFPFQANQTHTKFLITLEIDGKKYYYPIDLPDMAANNSYLINNVTIHRPGSTSPNKNIVSGAISFSITVKSWDNPQAVKEFDF